ncbi:ATP-binding protein [Vibrio sp. SCSIO 43136]|uniref:ATP-binding protein n=1 Tax=Vibrio sp. SCSIO 43136 TaxID=2819101 RepID=UPI0020755C2E|nr:ATP-binding protein [Vibrio sp. SCSIO 43136]USD67783.1 HAMP domain-containing protein [Vibrio sp. SCSIO 43136]
MRLSIFTKLFSSFLLVSVLLFAASALLINGSLKQGLQDYLNQQELEKVQSLATRTEKAYVQHGGWDRIIRNPKIWAEIMFEIGEIPPKTRDMLHKFAPARIDDLPRGELPRPPRGVMQPTSPLFQRLNLLDANKEILLGARENILRPAPNTKMEFIAIKVEGETVGWIAVQQHQFIAEPLADSFVEHQMQQVYLILAAGTFISLVIALILVRTWLTPMKALRDGTRKLTKGELSYRITTRSNDEFDHLVEAFNQLGESLQQQKQLREQWLGDIAHELRTPLAVLRSEIEAIQDGIRAPSAEYIDSLHAQTLNLTKLVGDLNTLAQSEHGSLYLTDESLDYSALANETVKRYQTRYQDKGLTLRSNVTSGIVANGDSKAMSQLLNNVLENSYRYTDEQGQVHFNLHSSEKLITIEVKDSAPAVAKAHQSKLFERLYRVDKSRSRTEGGSGLGLAICKNIVKAHGGTISAQDSELGGLSITIILPAQTSI